MEFQSRKMKQALFLISFGVILFWALNNLSLLFQVVGRGMTILSPFLLGIAIAFIFNGPMMTIEKYLYGKKGPLRSIKDSFKRPISYILTFLFFSVIIFVLLFLVIPELATAMIELGNQIPSYFASLEQFIERVFENNPVILNKIEEVDWSSQSENLMNFLRENGRNWLGGTFNVATSVMGSILNFGLAFVFSVYTLLAKEDLIEKVRKIISAYLPKKVENKIFRIGRMSNEAFSGFLNGKLREAFVIIILFAVTMKIFQFPYALTISVLIGTLTLIPWFGVFIGFTIGFFLILAVEVKMALWFLVIFITIYQLEGNFIYPIVVGKASGLSSIWIFVAGTLGAQVGGIVGLVLSIPIFSVVYALIADSVNRRLKKKELQTK